VRIETSFQANYEIELPVELPSSGLGVHYFPAIEAGRGQTYESSLKFNYANHRSWWGVFAARSKQTMGLSIASTMPNADFCIVSSVGTGYLIDVTTPEDWKFVEVDPVLQVTTVLDENLILLSDFTRIVAYDADGFRWRSERLCSDQLRITGRRNRFIECMGWDAAQNSDVRVRVNLLTGKVKDRELSD
jgi:hypothetical protein